MKEYKKITLKGMIKDFLLEGYGECGFIKFNDKMCSCLKLKGASIIRDDEVYWIHSDNFCLGPFEGSTEVSYTPLSKAILIKFANRGPVLEIFYK